MYTTDVFTAKRHFLAFIDQVKNGEVVIITKHGRPVAKLIPAIET